MGSDQGLCLLYVPVNNFSVMLGQVFLGWASTKRRIKCLGQLRTQHSDPADGEIRTRQPFDPKTNALPTEQLRSSLHLYLEALTQDILISMSHCALIYFFKCLNFTVTLYKIHQNFVYIINIPREHFRFS